MASSSGNPILVTFFLALTFSSMMSSGLAARHLLQTKQPSMPNIPGIPSNLPKPTGLPPMPSIPSNIPPFPTNLPKPSTLPPLPSMPQIPTVPQATLPPLPNMPSIPKIPTTMPSIPFFSPPPSN